MAGHGGYRPGSGRKKGQQLGPTLEERRRHASVIAAYARRRWREQVAKDRRDRTTLAGPRPSLEDHDAAVAHLEARRMVAIDGAIIARDYRAAGLMIEHALARVSGLPKIQMEHGGIEDGAPIKHDLGGVTFTCELADGTPAFAGVSPILPTGPAKKPAA